MSELYTNKGTLPLRILSLRYGADLVYGEETIDKRIISSVRVPNAVIDSVDFVSRNGDSVVFRTCSEEAEKVVFQIGTANAVLALKAAETVARDVVAVDINMGCPKHFSIQGGMGAALLQKPEVACDILKTLRRNLNIPVSCKIRLLPDSRDTIDTAKRLEDAGACAIGVHMRQIHERPRDEASWEKLAPVVSALSVPVLANGDVFKHEDIDNLRKISGASSFLIARGALANPSIFRKEGFLPMDQVLRDYLQVAAEVDNVFQNTKYNVMRMIPSFSADASSSSDPYGHSTGARVVTVPELAATKNGMQMYSLWNLQNTYKEHQDRFQAMAAMLDRNAIHEGQVSEISRSLPGAPERYAEALEPEDGELPSSHESCSGKLELFCKTCKIQLLSTQDFKLHCKGRRHKSVVRRQTASTISRLVAKAHPEQQDAAEDTSDVDCLRGKSVESGDTALEPEAQENRSVKRLKH